MTPKKTTHALLLASATAALAVIAIGCTKTVPGGDGGDGRLLPQTSPDNVLKNLQTVYKNRDYEHYAPLLADDFLFYFDPDTRGEHTELPEFWNRFDDSTHTALVLKSTNVSDVRIKLTYQPNALPVNEVGHEKWVQIQVTDTFLEVDLRPEAGQDEGITLQVDGQQQYFYFRKGKTPADTLETSETSKLYYLVRWRDLGRGQ